MRLETQISGFDLSNVRAVIARHEFPGFGCQAMMETQVQSPPDAKYRETVVVLPAPIVRCFECLNA
jgi:hypothetical protein